MINIIFLGIILLTASLFDYKHKIIPNEIILIGLFGAIFLNLYFGFLWNIFVAIIIFFIFSLLFYYGNFGGGDVKLMFLIGLLTGSFEHTIIIFMIAGLIFVISNFVNKEIRFAPYLLIAFIIFCFFFLIS